MSISIILSVVGVFLALSVFVGLAASWHRQHTSEDYFLGGRSLPWPALALSLATAGVRLEAWLAMVALVCAVGVAGGAMAWASLLGASVLGWILLPYLYRKKLFSPAEFLDRRYSPATRSVYILLVLPGLLIGVVVPALYVGGWALCEIGLGIQVDGLSLALAACILVVALATALYAIYGGLMAGAWAGAIQTLVLLAGGVVLTAVALSSFDGLGPVVEGNRSPRLDLILPLDSRLMPWTGMLALWFTLGLWNSGASPVVIQRCLGARSEWDAKLGVFVAGLLQILLAAVVALPGLAAFAKLGLPYGATQISDRTAVHAVQVLLDRQTVLGALGLGVLVSGVLAAAMSTVAAAIHAISCIWTMDVCQDMFGQALSEASLIGRGRKAGVITLVLGTLLAPLLVAWDRSILEFIFETSAVLGPPVAVVFVVAFFWPRAHGRAASTTLLLGVVAGIALWAVAAWGDEVPAWMMPVLNRAGITMLFSLLILGLTTFAIPQNERELYDPDTTWTPRWSRLPPYEQRLGEGPGNLLVWWGLLVMLTAAVWIVLR